MDENLDALSRVFAAAYSSAKAEGKSDEWSRISAARACSDFILGADNGWVEVEGPKRAAKKKPNSKN